MDHRRPATPSILPLCERYLVCYWPGAGKNRVCREAKYYHHYGSVDISTINAPIEDRTKGGCNLPLANGMKNFFGFKFPDFGN